MFSRHSRLLPLLVHGNDLATAAAAALAARGLAHLAFGGGLLKEPPAPPADLAPSMALGLILIPLVFGRFRLYEPKRTKSALAEASDVARAVAVVWGLVYIVTSLMRGTAADPTLLVALPVWLVLAAAGRLAARGVLRGLRRHGWNQRTAAIVGTGRLGQRLLHALRQNVWTGIAPAYFVGDPARRGNLLGLDVRGPMDAVEQVLAARPVDIAFVALSRREPAETGPLLRRLAQTGVDVRVVPDLPFFSFLRPEVGLLDDLPVIAVADSPLHGPDSLLKRAFDLAASAALVLLLGLPMLAIALAIKAAGGGPVFYRQQRATLGGRLFRILKFRTMVGGAEEATGPVWAAADDPRATPVGRFLRRTGLDELPQLFNVLAGQMSLVGPRPERPEFIDRFRREVPGYMLRSQVKPGITGWAQVHGLRGMTSLRKRLQYDLYYIANWTFGLDVRIILMTLAGLVRRPRGR